MMPSEEEDTVVLTDKWRISPNRFVADQLNERGGSLGGLKLDP